MRETLSWIALVTLSAMIGLVLLFLVGGGWLLYTKVFMTRQSAAETEAVRNTQQYVDSKQSLLLNLVSEYDRVGLEADNAGDNEIRNNAKSQQAAIQSRICLEQGKISQQWVPMLVTNFLRAHPCR